MTAVVLAVIAVEISVMMPAALTAAPESQLVVREFRSDAIAHNKIGVDPKRQVLVYLPAGYDESSSQRYPVIYFIPNPFQESYRSDFDRKDAQSLFDRAVAKFASLPVQPPTKFELVVNSQTRYQFAA